MRSKRLAARLRAARPGHRAVRCARRASLGGGALSPRSWIAAIVLAGGLALAGSAAAGGGTWRYDAYDDLMSPFCPGRTLADCPSQQAVDLREWIARQEEAGRVRAEVERELFDLYGEILLSAPRARGWGLTAYAIPIAAFLTGGALVALFLRRQVGPPAPGEAPVASVAPVDPELERRVDRELGAS